MIELIIDYATNKVIGYNKILPIDTTDRILVDDGELPRLQNLNLCDRLYYCNGQIIESENVSEYYQKLQNLTETYSKLQQSVDQEHKAFMDSILNGSSVEEASAISKQNRQLCKDAKKQLSEFFSKHKKKEEAAIIQKFQQEEANINYRYFLSMVTIVRDENEYLKEWIRYHIEELGFEHFYIYDNESAVPPEEYLTSEGFPHLSKLTFLKWNTTENSQQDAHNDFLKRFKNETKWFLAADPDEYVVLKEQSKTLQEILSENSDLAAIECIWHHFNANGQIKKTKGTDMERFTKEVDFPYGHGRGKRFAQTNRIQSMINHVPQPRLNAPIDSNLNEKFFQLNHYYTRSYEEWLAKISRGTAVPYCKKKYSEFFELNPDLASLNTGEDTKQSYGPAKKRSAPA